MVWAGPRARSVGGATSSRCVRGGVTGCGGGSVTWRGRGRVHVVRGVHVTRRGRGCMHVAREGPRHVAWE